MSVLTSAPRAQALGATLARAAVIRTLYFGLLGLMTLPVGLFPVPRAIDFVNHWARLTVLRAPADDPVSAFYRVEWGAIPNLGIDLFDLALSPALGPQSVARLAFALSFWLPALGAYALHRAFVGEKTSPTMLLVPLISYNVFTSFGLMNYGFGVGLALFALAFAVREPARALTTRGLLTINLFAVALFFCHLLALAGFCLLFGLMRMTPRVGEGWRPALLRGAASPLYVGLALALMIVRPPTQSGIDYVGLKSWVLLAPVYNGLPSDFARGGLPLGLILCLAVFLGLRVAPQARLALPVFAAVAVLAPAGHGVGTLIDARLTALAIYFGLSACVAREPERAAPWLTPAAVAFALFRLSLILPDWAAFDAHVAELRDAFRAIPLGSRALVVKAPGCDDSARMFEYQLANFAVIDRRSATNLLFALSGMQPIRSRDEKLAIAPPAEMSSSWLTEEGTSRLADGPQKPWAGAFLHWRDHFDVVVDVHGECGGDLEVPGLELAARSAFADVYRVR
jgi:hypothetical protein